jgi:hypothetical protein
MAKIRKGYTDHLDLVFKYLSHLDVNLNTTATSVQNCADTRVNLVQAISCMKEVYDNNNDSCQLYGITKLSKATYKTELEKCRSYFVTNPCQIWDVASKLESILQV